jgi:heparin binding hemagglutinin HbhA
MAENPTVEELKAPLLAAVGAADLALATVNEIVATLRERAEDARTDASARAGERRAALTERVDEARDRLAKMQDDLPKEIGELRDKLTADELRKVAESYAEAAQNTYNKLVERGEAAIERLRSRPAIEEAAERAEEYIEQAVELTQDALGSVATQTRAVGERAAKFVGVAGKGDAPAKKAAKKAPAKKTAAKKAPVKAAVKKAPAKKAPAKKVTQK